MRTIRLAFVSVNILEFSSKAVSDRQPIDVPVSQFAWILRLMRQAKVSAARFGLRAKTRRTSDAEFHWLPESGPE
jgi:hypothetical protein